MALDEKKLAGILGKMFDTEITRAEYQIEELHGGTVGAVKLVTGVAETVSGDKLPYKIVWKTQKKWERYRDPGSWRREYDLYNSGLGAAFTKAFRSPECYYAEINADETEIQLWLEYIDGVTGKNLTPDMYERAAEELGRFQGRLYAEKPEWLETLKNMSANDYAKSYYEHYRSWRVVYDYIRSEGCTLPKHICDMLISIDSNSAEVFERIEKLPVVLCHRDFWVANIFYTDNGIALIDWDTTGWGYLGEDIASLIADEADVCHMAELYQSCVPAYYRGFAEYAGISDIDDNCVYELILVLFGYRHIEWYIYASSNEAPQAENDEKALCLNTLEQIYEMGRNKLSRLTP